MNRIRIRISQTHSAHYWKSCASLAANLLQSSPRHRHRHNPPFGLSTPLLRFLDIDQGKASGESLFATPAMPPCRFSCGQLGHLRRFLSGLQRVFPSSQLWNFPAPAFRFPLCVCASFALGFVASKLIIYCC